MAKCGAQQRQLDIARVKNSPKFGKNRRFARRAILVRIDFFKSRSFTDDEPNFSELQTIRRFT